eukprot:7158095-Prymnesium_polylepis.1
MACECSPTRILFGGTLDAWVGLADTLTHATWRAKGGCGRYEAPPRCSPALCSAPDRAVLLAWPLVRRR